ncbi:2-oxoglutarate dehydrogenase-like, mitochondrial [Musca domestica]|uniref:2-oxoglutarate dehydrogenase, mitochondrial n=1 Tax=Musca domestica TaxID=7370 RepID=A0A9J7DMD6_MUSDO|nr:2-oxoglutarate dehydrogenase-like, mitochondrial [Musca domestica]
MLQLRRNCIKSIAIVKQGPSYFRDECKLLVKTQKAITGFINRRHASKTAKSEERRPPLPTAVGGGSSATYVEDMYRAWQRDPTCVHTSWDSYFRSGVYEPVPAESHPQRNTMSISQFCSGGGSAQKAIDDHILVHDIIRSYQTRGFLAANLDPLGIISHNKTMTKCGMQLNANENVFIKADFFKEDRNLDQSIKLTGATTSIGGDEQELSFREIIKRLENIYCDTMGIEYMYIFCPKKRSWIRERIEKPGQLQMSAEKKKLILSRLIRATAFENFLAKKWPSEKRFGLEGCEVLIPCLKEVIDRSSALGVESFIIGLAHRGRLNTLANICRKPLHQIFAQFRILEAEDSGSGDVKYHLGTYVERLNRVTNKNVRIALVANPSHLEAVNPIVMGKTRAEQFYKGDSEGRKVMSILIHGDAAFCGQGVVYESIHLSDLPSYTNHGTIHIVINNQVGFTTDPRFHRSSPFCTDVARVVNAPILHVNADDPEAAVFLSGLASEWRATWRNDIVLDLVGYRRNGHNEADEPMFTQPLMYQKIRKHKPVLELYSEKLVKEMVLSAEELKALVAEYDQILEEGFKEADKERSISYKDWIDSPWSGFFDGKDRMQMPATGVKEEVLLHIAQKFSTPPPAEAQFVIHKGIERILQGRRQMIKDRLADWALGEALAYGTLLKEGVHVRLSGEDVERGTFSHRHHVLWHQTIDRLNYNVLANLYPDQATYSVSNSSLSEYAVLGFEHGYSMSNPNALVMWEAQFGDFSNTGQAIFDQFISCGEMKWVRQSGLVVLLPHGMEGMGPEHSSCRLERFLQMCHDDPDTLPPCDCEDIALHQLNETNWIVANCTTPANLFHILRRQIALPFRKPLILCTPKSGLRHPLAKSPFSEMAECTEFKRIIADEGPAMENPDCVTKLVFCSGRVYFDLFKARADKKAEKKICLIRVEQICPFPFDLVREEILKYKNADVIWAQEEHKNQGAWNYVQPRFQTALAEDEDLQIQYHGRPTAAAPSTGNKKQHERELHDLLVSIFGELTEAEKEVLKKEEEARMAKAKAEAEQRAKVAKAAKSAENPKNDKTDPKKPSNDGKK